MAEKGLRGHLALLGQNLSLCHHQAITIAHDYSTIFEKDPEAWARFAELAKDIEETSVALKSLLEEIGQHGQPS